MSDLSIVGGYPLKGEIECGGSKNASLAIFAASSLAEQGESFLTPIPDITDVREMCALLRSLKNPMGKLPLPRQCQRPQPSDLLSDSVKNTRFNLPGWIASCPVWKS